jgi:hypothetical protein
MHFVREAAAGANPVQAQDGKDIFVGSMLVDSTGSNPALYRKLRVVR